MTRQVGSALGVALFVAILGQPTAATAIRDYQDVWTFLIACLIGAGARTALDRAGAVWRGGGLGREGGHRDRRGKTTLPVGTGYATADLHMRFIRPMNADTGRVIATGTVVHAGRRHAIVEGRIEVEATGKLIATGTADCPILRPS